MTETRTIWICPDCVAKLNAEVRPQATLELTGPGSLVTVGFRNPDDHHRDCDYRNSVAASETDRTFGVPEGEQATDVHDCNVACEEWDGCPYDCGGCGEGAGRTSYAATVWPAPVSV
jgi:hypothetical protein